MCRAGRYWPPLALFCGALAALYGVAALGALALAVGLALRGQPDRPALVPALALTPAAVGLAAAALALRRNENR